MESNEVIKVNLEFVQDLLYTVHTCIGKVKAYMSWFNVYTLVIALLTMISIIGFMI